MERCYDLNVGAVKKNDLYMERVYASPSWGGKKEKH